MTALTMAPTMPTVETDALTARTKATWMVGDACATFD